MSEWISKRKKKIPKKAWEKIFVGPLITHRINDRKFSTEKKKMRRMEKTFNFPEEWNELYGTNEKHIYLQKQLEDYNNELKCEKMEKNFFPSSWEHHQLLCTIHNINIVIWELNMKKKTFINDQ